METDGTDILPVTGTDISREKASTQAGLTKICYHSSTNGNSEIYLADFDGSNAVNLTNNSAEDFDPVLSGDGSKIIFFSNRNGAIRLYVMNSDGTGLTQVSSANFLLFATINYDGSKIAYSASPGVFQQVFVANADGSNPVNISNTFTDDLAPTFSQDGTKLAYSSNDILTIYDFGTGGKTQLVNVGGLLENPSFTPSGQQIIFNGAISSQWDIFRINIDGTGLVNLTNTSNQDEIKTSGFIGH